MDSGNLVGSAMDYGFFQTLGINMKPYHQQGQSAQGEPLTIMGIMEEINFNFHGKQILNLKRNLL